MRLPRAAPTAEHSWSSVPTRVRCCATIQLWPIRAGTFAGQRVEARIGSGILNRTARLGMPHSFRAA